VGRQPERHEGPGARQRQQPPRVRGLTHALGDRRGWPRLPVFRLPGSRQRQASWARAPSVSASRRGWPRLPVLRLPGSRQRQDSWARSPRVSASRAQDSRGCATQEDLWSTWASRVRNVRGILIRGCHGCLS
jgi:hypothetical protein